MNCQSARDYFPDLLDPRMTANAGNDSAAVAEARTHLAHCPDCQREFAALSQTAATLDALDVAPASAKLRANFYALLEEEKHSAASAIAANARHSRHARWRWVAAPVAACALLAAGFLAGTRYGLGAAPTTSPAALATDGETKRQLQELRSKVDQMEAMNQLVAATLVQQQRPASERLNTVLTSATQQNPTDRMINELITSLALDSSPNVRLRALDALYAHADLELVRTAVVASLGRETNPLVQVAMIDFLAAARDHEAKPTLEKLTDSKLVDENVRIAAKRALAQL